MMIGGNNNWTCFVATFSIAFAVYLSTVAPSTSGGDAGELLAESCKLGTAHPPGYPAIIILFHLAAKFGEPLGLNPALSVNVLCCVLGAASAGLLSSSVYLISSESKKQRKGTMKEDGSDTLIVLSAVASALMFAFSPIAWQYSVTAEVFALHSLFVSAIIHTSVRYAAHPTERLTYLGAILCGSSLTNQHTAILLEVPIVIWVAYKSKLLHRSHRSVLCKAALSFLGPIFFLYATMPYLTITQPHRGSWGDVTTLGGFLHHLLRRDYGTFQLYSGNDDGAESLTDRLTLWAFDGVSQSGNNPLACISFLIGCRQMMNLPIGRVVISCLAFYLVAFGTLANLPLSSPLFFAIHQRFWLHPNVLASIAVGVGIAKVGAFRTSHGEWSLRKMQFLIVAIMLASVITSLRQGLRMSDESDNVYFDRYARSVLQPLPKGSLLLLNYDQAWSSIRYVQECEGFREDVVSINTSMMSYPWFEAKRQLYDKLSFPGTHYTYLANSASPGFTIAELLEQNYQTLSGNVFIIGPLNYPDEEYRERYEEIPFGFARRIVLKEEEPGLDSFRAESHAVWSVVAKNFASVGLPDAVRYDASTWEFTIGVMFWQALTERATHLLDLATREGTKSSRALGSLVEACAWLEMAVANDDKAASSPNARKNLGVGYMKIVQRKDLGPDCILPPLEDVFEATGNQSLLNLSEHWWNEAKDGGDCKSWASARWQSHWKEFLSMDQAKALPDYGQVETIYNLVVGQKAEKARKAV
jgi:hypothetical protein